MNGVSCIPIRYHALSSLSSVTFPFTCPSFVAFLSFACPSFVAFPFSYPSFVASTRVRARLLLITPTPFPPSEIYIIYVHAQSTPASQLDDDRGDVVGASPPQRLVDERPRDHVKLFRRQTILVARVDFDKVDDLLVRHDVPDAVAREDQKVVLVAQLHRVDVRRRDDELLQAVVAKAPGNGQDAKDTITQDKSAALLDPRLLRRVGRLVASARPRSWRPVCRCRRPVAASTWTKFTVAVLPLTMRLALAV